MFYNQPNCCKGLKVCMNGRIFLVGVAMNRAKTVGKKVAAQSTSEPRGPKSGGGARAHRPNRSLRLWFVGRQNLLVPGFVTFGITRMDWVC